jgi:hypothetical protein
VPDNMDRVGILAEVAMAIAAVTYPIAKVVSVYARRRRVRAARRYAAPAAAVESRLLERCSELEARLARLEGKRA